MRSHALLWAIAAAGVLHAHPHAGGIVVQGDRVWVGDVVRSRLLVLEGAGVRAMHGFGHVRDLESAPNGEIYGVSQGGGLWKVEGNRPRFVLPDFNGLFSRCSDGTLALAAADALDRRPVLGLRTARVRLEQIDALSCAGDRIFVADKDAVRAIDRNGAITTIAENLGGTMHGIVATSDRVIVPVYERGEVRELSTGRVLLRSEAPWRPVDVAFRDGALYVVELAHYPCCFKGPRVRRVSADGRIATLLTIHEGDHLHLFPWLPVGAAEVLAIAVVAALAVRRRRSTIGR